MTIDQRAFGIENIGGHIEGGEIGADRRHHHLDRLCAHDRQPLAFGLLGQRVAILRSKRRADRLEVVARIKSLGNGADVLAERFAVAQIGGARERIDLRAGIVDVIFARHFEAGEREQVRQRVAEYGTAAMADMHRPGRIRRNIFDVDGHAAADIAGAVARTQPHGVAQRIDPGRGLKRQIDESRAGHVDAADKIVGAKLFRDFFGEIARLFAGILGEHHGGVGRHVAVRRIARRLDRDARLIDAGRQKARRNKGVVGAPHAVENFGKNVLCGHRKQHPGKERSNAGAACRAPNAVPGSSQRAARVRRARSDRSCRR